MDVTAEMGSPAPPEAVFAWIDDLALYPRWLTLVNRAEAAPSEPDDVGPAWSIDLRGRLGPLARAKRLRMVRTEHEPPHRVTFERREHDGRSHSTWVLRAELTDTGDGTTDGATPGERTRMVMRLHYDGTFFGPVLERVLGEEIDRSRPRLAALIESAGEAAGG